jgi:hypothetical protein
MGYFLPEHRGMLKRSAALAERIVAKETRWDIRDLYDVKTQQESLDEEKEEGVFAKLVRLEPEAAVAPPLYRVCVQDSQVFEFIRTRREVDLFSLLTFIMTHELVHIHRFATGKADFFDARREEEEIYVDNLARLFLAKNPFTGLKNVLTLLDKVEAAPLYSFTIFDDNRRCYNAYL